jgi:hypothetical protein
MTTASIVPVLVPAENANVNTELTQMMAEATRDSVTHAANDSLKGNMNHNNTRARVSFTNQKEDQPPKDLLPLPMTPEDPVAKEGEEEQDLPMNKKNKKKNGDYVLIAL